MTSLPPIDPGTNGVRLRLFAPGFDPHGSAILDASIPGGAGWTPEAGGQAWTYRDPAGRVGGITRVTVRFLPPLVPNPLVTKVAFTIRGRRGSYAVPSGVADTVLQATLSLLVPGSASNRQCGDVFYASGVPNRCASSASGDRLSCAAPRPVGPCHVGDPNDLVVCDALDAAHAQDAYFAAHGTYFTGSCTGLPGFVASPGVSCGTSGTVTSFTATTVNTTSGYTCTWWSAVPPNAEHLVCY